MDAIATTMGVEEQWHGVGDYTQDVADLIGSTGRPHPGNRAHDPAGYAAELAAWSAAHAPAPDDPRGVDHEKLNALATYMASSRNWSADTLEGICEHVAATGRPNPAGAASGAGYLGTLRKWRFEHGLADDDGPLNYVKRVTGELDQPMLEQVYEILAARGDVADAAFWAVDEESLPLAYNEHFANPLDEIADEMDDPWLPPRVADHDALAHLDEECEAAGLPVMACALRELNRQGQVSSRMLAGVHHGRIEGLYERHLGPAIDAFERSLLKVFPEDRR